MSSREKRTAHALAMVSKSSAGGNPRRPWSESDREQFQPSNRAERRMAAKLAKQLAKSRRSAS